MRRIVLAPIFLAAAGLASAQYSLNDLAVRPGLAFQSEVSVSHHGKFMIATALDSKGTTHYLLYGPDFMQTPQDLSLAAGPTPGSSTPWNGAFLAVNDHGLCLAAQSIDGYAANIFLFSHETHTLTQVLTPKGDAFAIPGEGSNAVYDLSVNQVIAGTVLLNYTNTSGNINWTGTRPFRWSPSVGLKQLFVGTPGLGVSSAINDSDFQIGSYAPFPSANPNAVGFIYQVGPINGFAFEPGNATIATAPTCVNDLGQVAGDYYSYTGTYPFYDATPTQPANGANSLGSYAGLTDYVGAIDNFGRIFGIEEGYNSSYQRERYPVLWQGMNTNQIPVLVTSLIPSGSDPTAQSWNFTTMDLNGVIYGYYTDGSGNNFPVTLTP
jgi:hypothetical protein